MIRNPFIRFVLTVFALFLLTGPAFAETADEEQAPKPKILILGGTGFLGPWEVEAALANGHEVTLFNRGKTRRPAT